MKQSFALEDLDTQSRRTMFEEAPGIFLIPPSSILCSTVTDPKPKQAAIIRAGRVL